MPISQGVTVGERSPRPHRAKGECCMGQLQQFGIPSRANYSGRFLILAFRERQVFAESKTFAGLVVRSRVFRGATGFVPSLHLDTATSTKRRVQTSRLGGRTTCSSVQRSLDVPSWSPVLHSPVALSVFSSWTTSPESGTPCACVWKGRGTR